VALILSAVGCQSPKEDVSPEQVSDYQERMTLTGEDEAEVASLPPAAERPPAVMVGDVEAEAATEIGKAIRTHLSDPKDQRERLEEIVKQITDPKETKLTQDFIKRLSEITGRPTVRLSLGDVVRRMLENNFTIRIAAYQPAIDTARVVEAEATFDSIYFFNFTNDKRDRPSSAPELIGTSTEIRTFAGGVRKLLSSGTQVSVSYNWNRTESDQGFLVINPAYTQTINATMRQPLLRNFGVDFNRSQINVSKNDRRIGQQQLRREMRDQLQAVEDAYWLLVRARRSVTVQAELIAYTKDLYNTYQARLGFDVFPAQVSQIGARLETRIADFVRIINGVLDAEDELKRVMNDPDLDLATDVNIVPTDFPTYEPIVLNRLEVLQAALDFRSELKEARLRVQNARISVGVAKNQALPRFDLAFTVQANGLGTNSSDGFHSLTDFDFLDYVVQVDFEVPVGNRGPRAAARAARLQYAQAATAVRRSIEDIVADVNTSIRRLQSEFDQLSPRVSSALSAADFLSSVRAREITKSADQLETELNSQEQLANARLDLLQTLVDYNRAIVNLERAKGTLLEFNNVVLEDPFQPEPLNN